MRYGVTTKFETCMDTNAVVQAIAEHAMVFRRLSFSVEKALQQVHGPGR